MLYCFDPKILGKMFYAKKEMEIAKRNHNGILYDSDTKQFLDFSHREVDIKERKIFPRTGSTQIYEMNEEIVRQGGIPVLTTEKIKKVCHWPIYYSGNRRIQILKGEDLTTEETIRQLEQNYGTELFLKTVEKDFSRIIPITLLQDRKCVFFKTLLYHLDQEFIVSEKMDLVKDQYGTKEYRCFVRNHQVMNISRTTKRVLHSIDESVLTYANQVVEALKEAFPSDYVLDVVEKQQGDQTEMDIVEINPIHASGLYLYNSLLEPSPDILHKNLWNLPEEWREKKERYLLEGSMDEASGDVQEYKGQFTLDLISVFLMGSRGYQCFDFPKLGVEEFSKRVPELTQFTKVISDFDMKDSGTVDEKDSIRKGQSPKQLLLQKKQ